MVSDSRRVVESIGLVNMAKLALGTVAFGKDYGVTNEKGIVTQSELHKILLYCKEQKILTLDTAAAYGESESNLGRESDLISDFSIVTKTIPNVAVEQMEGRFLISLRNLKAKKLHGLLVHNPRELLSERGDDIWKLLERLKQNKLVDKIGVSIYTENEIEKIIAKYPIDLIQVPINVFDQRLLNSGVLSKLKAHGIEIHARSIFLQGILITDPQGLPKYFDPYKRTIMNWHQYLSDNNLTPLEGALDFIKNISFIDRIIVGVTSLNNLVELNETFNSLKAKSPIDCKQFSEHDEKLINPSLWYV